MGSGKSTGRHLILKDAYVSKLMTFMNKNARSILWRCVKWFVAAYKVSYNSKMSLNYASLKF